jgi:hypothetical protein
VEVGKVIRTEPAYNEQVKTGDTIKIYVCAQKLIKMPNVVGKDVEVAKELLTLKGFSKFKIEEKTSDKTKDTVLEQSVAVDKEVAADTEIVLTVSVGKKSLEYTITNLFGGTGAGGGDGEATMVTIVVTNTTTGLVELTKNVSTAENSLKVNLSGYGVMNYKYEIDGIQANTFTVDFDKK